MSRKMERLKIKVMFYKADLKGFLSWKVVLGDIQTMERNCFQHELSCLSSETNVTPLTSSEKQGLPFLLSLSE